MTASSIEGRRGSQPIEGNSNAEQIPTAITKADQMAWEAPDLRPIECTSDWYSTCPSWCNGKGRGHEEDQPLFGIRKHQSPEFRVRQDSLYAYWDDDDSITSGHLALSLVQPDRWGVGSIQIVSRSGDGKGARRTTSSSARFTSTRCAS